MSEDLAEELGRNIPLSEMIQSLRQELSVALQAGQGESIRFAVEQVELELQIAITRGKGASGKIAFGVVQFGGEVGTTRHDTHRFRLQLKPESAGGPEGSPTPLKLSGVEPRRPEQ